MMQRDVGHLLTRKRVLWFLGVLLVGWLGWFLAFAPAYYSQLAMPMKVHLDRAGDTVPIKTIWLRSDVKRHSRLEHLLANKDETAKWAANQQFWGPTSFDGHTFDFRIPGDDSGSMLGITLSYAQHDHLLIIAELADGRRVGTIADIPDARTTREMRVTLP